MLSNTEQKYLRAEERRLTQPSVSINIPSTQDKLFGRIDYELIIMEMFIGELGLEVILKREALKYFVQDQPPQMALENILRFLSWARQCNAAYLWSFVGDKH